VMKGATLKGLTKARRGIARARSKAVSTSLYRPSCTADNRRAATAHAHMLFMYQYALKEGCVGA